MPSHSVVHHASGALDFADASGTVWTVSEIARMDFSERVMALLPHPERRQGWLLFESQFGERRRYTPIPENWRSFGAAVLQQCLAKAVQSSAAEHRRRDDQDR
ncbi:MAG TPA: hypothetical protein VJW73_00560 [Gemmatimonadaceae bacterium]|nr:hypothetical protein [Gemmatimonadaceae bacterium]